ncbi:hypothetical protein ACFSYH_02025 [Populibacterium corticicola]|uniref:Uncharacterized protein n=1 Tax=Populibacterium corticicola TaxID=1812826 RepID=A0ABW5XE27_9MICO
MPRIAYEDWNPSQQSLNIVQIASAICAEYAQQGYDLTLRQLYYQFVARDYLPNNQRSYKNLGAVIDRARKAGLLDWDYITDRTRNLSGLYTYTDPSDLIEQSVNDYHVDLWQHQDQRIEVWVEKEALAGVIARSALKLGVNYFSCRGYVSQSELHQAALRHRAYEDSGQEVTVIHLGDHDPSGIDMTRDIADRLALFGASTTVKRIALNRDQIDEFNPPPNPAKLTDSRARNYINEFGKSSWELDALNPDTLAGLIENEILTHMDADLFNLRTRYREEGRNALQAVSDNWHTVKDFAEGI